MEQIKNWLEARENFLLQVKKEKEDALINVREGSLRICHHDGRTQYYERNNPKDFNGRYIQEKDFSIAQKLAQQDYDKKVLRMAEKELHSIRRFLSNLGTTRLEQVYENMHKERQKLVIPICETDETFVQNWESMEYQRKGFGIEEPEYYTMKGERVRSKSEVLIADMLYRDNILYRYEYPIHLNGLGKVYPDFTVLNVRERKEYYWEHMGMMDEKTYADKAIRKISLYEKNEIFPGEKLILTYESMKNPINQKEIQHIINHYLK